MKLLLDTHILLWWLSDDPALSVEHRAAIADPANIVCVSAATAWEISIKKALGELDAPDDLVSALISSELEQLPITVAHAEAVGQLPPHHRDPFDRMLIAQAQVEDLAVVTGDPVFARYAVARF
ncbi:MAG: type II toxin-antitoxin system VapC family toxin [Acidimicrobiia bacterium]|nr:type II toxin-antitoxin system VapC family toxin [Acidimicrobiia bacterium]